MHPKALELYQICKASGHVDGLQFLENAHHFHVSDSISDFAFELMKREYPYEGYPRGPVPITAKLPASEIVMTVDLNNIPALFLLSDHAGWIRVHHLGEKEIYWCGDFMPGNQEMRVPNTTSLEVGDLLCSKMMYIAFMLIVINEPRYVQRTIDQGSRTHRKLVKRVTGKAVWAWTNVTWELGKAVNAKNAGASTEGHKKALHWCRAHWAIANQGEPKAEWVNLPRKGGWGWYCWKRDCFKGDPQYGVKFQRHIPNMPGDPMSRFAQTTGLQDQTRFDALTGTYRAMLGAAGYAPSRVLH